MPDSDLPSLPRQSLEDFAEAKLARLEAKALRRTLVDTARGAGSSPTGPWVERQGRRLLSFCCNDYLGLSQHPAVKQAAVAALERHGVGAGASRLVTGNHPLYAILEEKLAALKQTEAACVFGSGYLANTGIIPALIGRNDAVFVDELAHSCILSGAELSGAAVHAFRHNDAAHLKDLLAIYRGRHKHALIATDGVFSMDGDLAPLPELAALGTQFDAWLLADDAHGIGVVGGGRGSTFAFTPKADVPLQMGTLSKAVGGYGGYLCASRAVVDFIKTRARTLVFSTGLPPATLAAAIAALDIIAADPAMTALPVMKARLFTRRLGLTDAVSPIVPLVVGKAEDALAASRLLEDEGFLVTAIRPPTVPRGTSRLRLTFTATHDDGDIARLAALISEKVPALMSGVFVAGTGTDVGKTFVCAGLIRMLKARGTEVAAIKPLVTGFDPGAAAASDPGQLLAALGRPVTLENIAAISPWRYADPLSPDMAARRAGRAVDFRALVDFSKTATSRGFVVVEGVGGVMVPLDGERTTLDWMAALGFPAILVCGSYLGTLSHTLSALAVLKQRRIEVQALVVNQTPGSSVSLNDTVHSLNSHAPFLAAFALTRDSPDQEAVFAKLADAIVKPIRV